MRHRVYGKHLGRDKNQRASLFKSLVGSLFTYGTIETSETKTKAIKGMIDKIINLAKNKNAQHLLEGFFVSKQLKERAIKEVAPSLSDRQSGYTNLTRLGVRRGDNTMMIRMSLIGNEKMEPFKVKGKGERVKGKEKIIEIKPVENQVISEELVEAKEKKKGVAKPKAKSKK